VKIKSFDWNWLLVVLLCAFAVAPLAQPGFFWGAHDARHSVYFLVEFDRSIQDGILYPRWQPDYAFGYGYPFFNIYSPLAFYLGEAFHLLGLDFVAAVKVIFGLGFVLSALTMYVFARRVLGRWPGLVAAVVYVYVPYRLGDVYVRGVLAESFAFVFFPLLLWAFLELVETGQRRYLLAAGVSYAALLCTHNGTAFVFSLLLGAYIVVLVAVKSWRAGRGNLLSNPSLRAQRSNLQHGATEKLLRRYAPAQKLGCSNDFSRLLTATATEVATTDLAQVSGLRNDAAASLGTRNDELSDPSWRATEEERSNLRTERRPSDGRPHSSSPVERGWGGGAGQRGWSGPGILVAAGRVLAPCALALLLGVGLAAIFLLPALLETRYVNVAQWTSAYYDFRRHFVYFFQLFSPFWGFGYSDAGPRDAMSFQLGAVPLVLAILSLGTTFQVPRSTFHVSRLDNVKFICHCEEHPFAGPERSEEPALSTAKGSAKGGDEAISLVAQQRDCFAALAMTNVTLSRRFTLTIFFQLATAVTIFLMLAPAAPLWAATPLASFAQFPWRLLALTTLSMTFLAGAVVAGVQAWRQRLAGLLVVPLLAVIVWGSWPYLWPQIIPPKEGPVSLAGLMRFQQSSGEMVGLTAWADIKAKPTWGPLADLYVAGKPVESKLAYSLLPAGMTVQALRHRTILDELRVTSAQGGKVTFYTQYYPGWRAYLDGREVAVVPEGDLGWMTVEVPAGEHVLLLRFEDTPVRVAGTVITLLTGFWVVAVWGWDLYRRRRESVIRE